MRLNRLVANSLEISRRKADKLIEDGVVLVNGKTASFTDIVTNIEQITVNNIPLKEPKDSLTILFNKPLGYVCSRNGQGNKSIYDLLSSEYQHLNPIGRLDKDTSGLLLLTNDGALNFNLSHPSNKKQKIYFAVLDKTIKDKDLTEIECGILLNDGLSKFKINRSKLGLYISMHEGRNRQIRRTFEALGYKVIKLHRTKFGDYELGTLKTGKISKLVHS